MSEVERELLYHRIECMLFVAGEPVLLEEIARVLDLPLAGTKELLAGMEQAYRQTGHGIFPMVTEDTCQMVSNPAYRNDIENLLQPEKTKSVSTSVMETLAVIAYRQPVTRADIEGVRGVRCEYAVSTLEKMGLIIQVGRRDTIGRPALFGTTDLFLRKLGIHSLEELPDFARFAEMDFSSAEESQGV